MKCTHSILADAIAYLDGLRSYLVSLEGAGADHVSKEWKRIRERAISHGDFDSITAKIAGDIGMESRDIVAFRKKHHENVLKELSAQRYDVDVHSFIRKTITARLLDQFRRSNLDPDDLKAMGMKPGRDLGIALAKGQDIWTQCSYTLTKNEVIAQLQQLGMVPVSA
jgi:hypothetical protein